MNDLFTRCFLCSLLLAQANTPKLDALWQQRAADAIRWARLWPGNHISPPLVTAAFYLAPPVPFPPPRYRPTTGLGSGSPLTPAQAAYAFMTPPASSPLAAALLSRLGVAVPSNPSAAASAGSAGAGGASTRNLHAVPVHQQQQQQQPTRTAKEQRAAAEALELVGIRPGRPCSTARPTVPPPATVGTVGRATVSSGITAPAAPVVGQAMRLHPSQSQNQSQTAASASASDMGTIPFISPSLSASASQSLFYTAPNSNNGIHSAPPVTVDSINNSSNSSSLQFATAHPNASLTPAATPVNRPTLSLAALTQHIAPLSPNFNSHANSGGKAASLVAAAPLSPVVSPASTLTAAASQPPSGADISAADTESSEYVVFADSAMAATAGGDREQQEELAMIAVPSLVDAASVTALLQTIDPPSPSNSPSSQPTASNAGASGSSSPSSSKAALTREPSFLALPNNSSTNAGSAGGNGLYRIFPGVYGGSAALGDCGRDAVTALTYETEAAEFLSTLRNVNNALAAHFEQARLAQLLAVDLAPMPKIVSVSTTAAADCGLASSAAGALTKGAAHSVAFATAKKDAESFIRALSSVTSSANNSSSDESASAAAATAAIVAVSTHGELSAPTVEPLVDREARLCRLWARVAECALLRPLTSRISSALLIVCRDRDVVIRRKQALLRRHLRAWGQAQRRGLISSNPSSTPFVSTPLATGLSPRTGPSVVESERLAWGSDWTWGCEQAFLGVARAFASPDHWALAVAELSHIGDDCDANQVPSERVDCLLDTAKAIYKTHNAIQVRSFAMT